MTDEIVATFLDRDHLRKKRGSMLIPDPSAEQEDSRDGIDVLVSRNALTRRKLENAGPDLTPRSSEEPTAEAHCRGRCDWRGRFAHRRSRSRRRVELVRSFVCHVGVLKFRAYHRSKTLGPHLEGLLNRHCSHQRAEHPGTGRHHPHGRYGSPGRDRIPRRGAPREDR